MKKIYYFSAEWCGPCRAFKPLVESTSRECGVNINYIDVDSNPDLSMKYGIRSVPTMIVTDENGNVIKKESGVMPKSNLINFLK